MRRLMAADALGRRGAERQADTVVGVMPSRFGWWTAMAAGSPCQSIYARDRMAFGIHAALQAGVAPDAAEQKLRRGTSNAKTI